MLYNSNCNNPVGWREEGGLSPESSTCIYKPNPGSKGLTFFVQA